MRVYLRLLLLFLVAMVVAACGTVPPPRPAPSASVSAELQTGRAQLATTVERLSVEEYVKQLNRQWESLLDGAVTSSNALHVVVRSPERPMRACPGELPVYCKLGDVHVLVLPSAVVHEHEQRIAVAAFFYAMHLQTLLRARGLAEWTLTSWMQYCAMGVSVGMLMPTHDTTPRQMSVAIQEYLPSRQREYPANEVALRAGMQKASLRDCAPA